jgi:hypothetical protein
MALSDSCAQFYDDVTAAAGRLAEEVEWYAASPLDYEREEIETLRAACAEVAAAAKPGDLDRLRRAVIQLVRLAEYTRNRHDSGQDLPPYDPPTEARDDEQLGVQRNALKQSAWVTVLNDDDTFTGLDGSWIAPANGEQGQALDDGEFALSDLPVRFGLHDLLVWAIDNGCFDDFLATQGGGEAA